jgi:kumamolisin
MSDIQQFDASAGLSDPQIQQYTVNGPFRLGSSGETTMDLEWAHALAPGADLQVYYINNNVSSSRRGWSDLASAVRQAAANGASIISMSFGSCRADTGYTATKNALAAVMKQGVSAFVASGDDGAHPGPVKDCGTKLGVSYPASDPSVAAVGGTSLLLNDDNTIASETAWSRSGGGKGNPLLRPAWQVAASLHPGKYRYAPDVAFLGNPSTGVEVFYKGDWYRAGGTSLGAPGWSAIWALLRQDAQQQGKTVGAAPPLLYRIGNSTAAAQAFHDITTGSNGKYKAGTGWDAVTGWGTPDANGLASTLAG